MFTFVCKKTISSVIVIVASLCSIQVILYSDSKINTKAVVNDFAELALTKINEIKENPLNHLGKIRKIVGTIERIIDERFEGVIFYALKDDYGGTIMVKSLNGKLPKEYIGQKIMIIGTVELDSTSNVPNQVFFYEKSRSLCNTTLITGDSEYLENPQGLKIDMPTMGLRFGMPKVTLFVIVLGSIGVTCASIGLGFFVWLITRKSQKQEILTQVWGTSTGAPPPLPPVNAPTEVVKDTSVTTAVVLEHGYLGILSEDGKESGQIDLYKHGDVNENGEYVYTLSRAIHGDEHRTIKLSEDDNLATRGVHAKLFVNKTTGEFKVAQFYSSNSVTVRRNNAGDVIKLKQGDPPVVMEDKDVITVGKSKLVFHIMESTDEQSEKETISISSNPLYQTGSLELPCEHLDLVHFSMTSPQVVKPAASFVIYIWAHLERHRDIVIQRAQEEYTDGKISIQSKGPVKVTRGTILSVRLKLEGLIVENPEDTILWEGEIGNAMFLVKVSEDAKEGSHSGVATIYIDGMQISRLYFVIQIGATQSQIESIPTQEERHRKAFPSYSSKDRDAVLARIQGIQKVAPYLEFNMDVLRLRSGQYWEQELWKIIPQNDIFYLFWSKNACKSEWVEKEWRCAFKTKGIDFIDPVPLVSPEEVPPPPELAGKHFNDWVLSFMRGKNASSQNERDGT